ncbi:hypothetical protein GCM10009122_03430 [Fulvivirga kasyanovii]|uniref:Lipoprotein n=1 Tax=Fulvivirga kasyanovii TaxID=396812 RepID=A0ABW9RV85_9BACT|nr:hypothetical protein [Fulvivirga kasyanovii]MTI26895.1 hypothetical protein [Fulvivirga kasyanovii]
MKRYLFIIVLAVLAGCAGTKVTEYTGTPRLLANSTILFLPTHGISDYKSQDLCGIARRLLKDNSQVLYLPEEEYNLTRAGMGKEEITKATMLDTGRLALICKKLQIRYIIGTEISSLRGGGSYGVYSEAELDPYNSTYNMDNESNSASLLFSIYDAQSGSVDSRFAVKTTINPLHIHDDGGGESRVNLTDQMTALTTAYEKGIKLIRKEMVSVK